MLLCKLKLAAVAAADAELVDAPVSHQVMAAAQHTGVAQSGSQIIVPQICMGVKMYDMQVRMAL